MADKKLTCTLACKEFRPCLHKDRLRCKSTWFGLALHQPFPLKLHKPKVLLRLDKFANDPTVGLIGVTFFFFEKCHLEWLCVKVETNLFGKLG